ncbi:MAG: OsmC family protein [Acidimicrobiales bacterium]
MAERRQSHHYQVTCTWSGSTGAGYGAYDRTHHVTTTPETTRLDMSADPAFRGAPHLLDPEQLLLCAAASCQLLSFLAIAARARVDVVAYEDEAGALMPEDDPPCRITDIHLRPHITVRGAVSEERVLRLVDLAHQECFIANSLTSRFEITPTIEVTAG